MLQLHDEHGGHFWLNPDHVMVVSSGRKRADLCALLMDHTPDAVIIDGMSAESVASQLTGASRGATRFVEVTDQDGSREWINAAQVRQIRAASDGSTEICLARVVLAGGLLSPARLESLTVRVQEAAADVVNRLG